MKWIDEVGQPLCATQEEAEEYITAELTRSVPEGWSVERFPDPRLPGATARMSWAVNSISQSTSDYRVRLTASREFIIFTYGNNDAGPGSIGHDLQLARVIEAWQLRRYGLKACLEHVMSTCKPNQWGLS